MSGEVVGGWRKKRAGDWWEVDGAGMKLQESGERAGLGWGWDVLTQTIGRGSPSLRICVGEAARRGNLDERSTTRRQEAHRAIVV
ncbi:unnamed protein product [Allacma fusca]|uniref:Uncharacterized protein n=1 Tax=Allacma fusca TaxID=39272 RepID=A0A8J2PFU5_9HEXA|nr:unnamed protein product [Allacma fusca]